MSYIDYVLIILNGRSRFAKWLIYYVELHASSMSVRSVADCDR